MVNATSKRECFTDKFSNLYVNVPEAGRYTEIDQGFKEINKPTFASN